MKTYFLLTLVFLLLNCQSQGVDADTEYEATFINFSSIGCRLPIINFTKGLEKARKLTNVQENYKGYFSVSGLNTLYWKPGKLLKLTIRQPTQVPVCDALGAWYPIVEVTSIK